MDRTRKAAPIIGDTLGSIMNVCATLTVVGLAVFGSIASAAEPKVCENFRQLGWPSHQNLYRRALTPSMYRGAKEDGLDHFFNIDLNGDDVEDEITVGCSHSSMPADPCMLEVKLSTGGSYTFEAWKMFLVRLGRGVFAIVTDIEGSKDSHPYKIYRLDESGVSLVCKAPR